MSNDHLIETPDGWRVTWSLQPGARGQYEAWVSQLGPADDVILARFASADLDEVEQWAREQAVAHHYELTGGA